VIVVDGQVGVVVDFNISDLVVVYVIFVDLFADDVQTDMVVLFQHDLHLVHDKLKLLSSVHRPISLNLNLLQDVGCLHQVILIFLALYDH
jgi:hypothetical protein